MVRKNAMLTVVNPAVDPLGPKAFQLEAEIQSVLRDMQQKGRETIPQLRWGSIFTVYNLFLCLNGLKSTQK